MAHLLKILFRMSDDSSMSFKFYFKQKIKQFIQNIYLPAVYKKASKVVKPDKKKVIFADMHSDGLPFSMQAMYSTLVQKGYKPLIYTANIGKMSWFSSIRFMRRFMKEYAGAGYVFICSYFLPVSSCKKNPDTKVIQLWHSGGLMKKMGYDTKEDIPEYYKGNVTANYDLVTVSSTVCERVWERALRLPKGITHATGLSRTDMYFDEQWNLKQTEKFYKLYPEAKGKKVVLYAPSFSGNAAMPQCFGIETGIDKMMQKFSDDYFFIVRLHPLLRKKYPKFWTKKDAALPTECLLPVTNILITDYSSVLFDYCIYKKPFVLYCPDIEEYKSDRGLYVNIEDFPAPLTKSIDELEDVMRNRLFFEYDEEDYEGFCEKYMGMCDGKSSDRILNIIQAGRL